MTLLGPPGRPPDHSQASERASRPLPNLRESLSTLLDLQKYLLDLREGLLTPSTLQEGL